MTVSKAVCYSILLKTENNRRWLSDYCFVVLIIKGRISDSNNSLEIIL